MQTPYRNHTKEAWLEGVKKEFPEGKTLEDLFLRNDLYEHDGFPWPAESNAVDGIVPVNEWKILSDCTDPVSAQAALANGTEVLLFTPSAGQAPEHWLTGVDAGFVDLLINGSRLDEFDLTAWNSAISASSAPANIRFLHNQPMADGFTLLDVGLTSKASFDALVHTILDQINGPSRGWMVQHTLGADFYGEIAWARALRLVVLKICQQHQSEKSLLLSAQFSFTGADPNQDMIRFSYQALSAVLGGYDFLAGIPWTGEDFRYPRLVQNLHHMMKHESKLHLFRDPMAGSYFMEDITEKWVAETLQHLEK